MDRSNVVSALDKLATAGLVRTNKISGEWYSCYCPFHGDGNEKKPSFGVLLNNQSRNGRMYRSGFCHCFACSYAKKFEDFVSDLFVAKDVRYSSSDWLTENLEGYQKDDEYLSLLPNEVISSLQSKYAVSMIQSTSNKSMQSISDEELASYRFTVPYMYKRGLTDELIEKYDIGYDANHIPPGKRRCLPCITFPVRDRDGKTLFFCRRSVEGKYFNYPQGVEKPVYGIYELPPNCPSVVVCESCFNALTSVKYGRPAVALLGTGNTLQIQQLKELGVKEFILAFDPDDAGRRATAKLKRALKSVAIVWSFSGIPEGKDINDLSKEEFDSLELE